MATNDLLSQIVVVTLFFEDPPEIRMGRASGFLARGTRKLCEDGEIRGRRGAGEEASEKNAKFFIDTDTTVGQAGS